MQLASSAARTGEVTRLLRAARDGDARAIDRIVPLVYEDLRRVARRQLARRFGSESVRPTELVHEAYVKRPLKNTLDLNALHLVFAERMNRRWSQMKCGKSATFSHLNATRQPNRWRHVREVICEGSGERRTRALIRIACMIVSEGKMLLRNFDPDTPAVFAFSPRIGIGRTSRRKWRRS